MKTRDAITGHPLVPTVKEENRRLPIKLDALDDERLYVIVGGEIHLDLPASICTCKRYRRRGICRHLWMTSAILQLIEQADRDRQTPPSASSAP